MNTDPGPPRVEGGSRLGFAPHVRFREDAVRGGWVVLSPEKLFVPDENAVEVLRRVDGQRDVDAIVDELAAGFDAPREVIATDVVAMLQDLVDKGVLARR